MQRDAFRAREGCGVAASHASRWWNAPLALAATYADGPGGARSSTCARRGSACAMVQREATGRRGTANRVSFEAKLPTKRTERESCPTDDGRLTAAVTRTYSRYPSMHEAVRAGSLALTIYKYWT
jgi:hypothetical protein